MAEDCVAIVARFGGELLEVRHLRRGGRYTIGTAPGVDLAIQLAPASAPSLSLIEHTATGFVVRRPPGVLATRFERGRGIPLHRATEIAIEPGVTVELVLDKVVLEVSLVRLPAGELARRRVERRPIAYATLSLAAHLALYLVAIGMRDQPLPTPIDETDPGMQAKPGTPMRSARIAMQPQTARRADERVPAATPVVEPTPTPEPPKRTAAGKPPGERADRRTEIENPTIPTPSTSTEGRTDGPTEGREAFSDSRRFDPLADSGFDTAKSGDYTTVSTGRTAGSDYSMLEPGQRSRLVVVKCDDARCLVVGGEQAGEIRQKLQARLPDIVACYAQRGPSKGREVELDFKLDEAGQIGSLAVGGVGDVDSCVANVVRSIQFSDA